MKHLIILSLVVLAVTNCASGKNNTKKDTSMTYQILLKGSHSNVEQAKNVVIKDKKELTKYYELYNSGRDPKILVPEVDFEKNMVVGIFLGEQTTGGFDIEIQSIKNTQEQMQIFYNVKAPDGPAIMVMTQPFILIKVSKVDSKVIFKQVK